MEGIRERKTVRSFLRSLNPTPQSLLILFLCLLFPTKQTHTPISHYSASYFFICSFILLSLYSLNLTAHLYHRYMDVERERKREKVEMIFLERENVNSRICIHSLPFPSKPKHKASIVRSKP